MLIRHDLKLAFLHLPKCAGKELRRVLSYGCPEGRLESLFNYTYSSELGRYVDLAHLTMADLRHRPEFEWLNRYVTVACVRSPYARLRSAATEYYRQRSAVDEKIANTDQLTRADRWAYYRQLPMRHCQQDPRFVHSQPMYRFTHLGDQPMVDHLLRCESLLSDLLALGNRLGWPAELLDEARRSLQDYGSEGLNWEPEELAMSHRLYWQDFQLFGYGKMDEPLADAIWPEGWLCVHEQLQPSTNNSADIDLMHYASLVQWHWGPEAHQPRVASLMPTRRND
jgi:hypothetical protein